MKSLAAVHLLILIATGFCNDAKLGRVAESFKVRGSKEENKLLGEMENRSVGNVEKLLTGNSNNILKNILTGATFSGKLKHTISNGNGGFQIRRQKMDSRPYTQGQLLSRPIWRDLKEVDGEMYYKDFVIPIEMIEHSESAPKIVREFLSANGGHSNEEAIEALKSVTAEDLVYEPSAAFVKSYSEFQKELKRRVYLVKRRRWGNSTTTTSTMSTTSEMPTATTITSLRNSALNQGTNKESLTGQINNVMGVITYFFTERFGISKNGKRLLE